MKGIIIEGVAASGKSEILKLLNKEITKAEFPLSKIILSEHYTQRMLEHLKENGQLKGYHVKNHVEKLMHSLAVYQEMLDRSKFSNNPRNADLLVIIERFILTHFASLPIEKEYSIDEARKHLQILSNLGIRQIVLKIPEKHMSERIFSTVRYRNKKWKEHLYSLGNNKEEIIQYYIDWQNRFLYYIDQFKDSIKTKIIEVKDTNYQFYSKEILKELY